MKKVISIILIAAGCFCTLTCCGKRFPDKNDFEFILQDPVTSVRCGETIRYSAKLINKTHADHTLSHGFPLISLYVYNYGEAHEEGIGASLIKSNIDADGFIEKNISVCFTEQGEYILRAYCVFFIDENEFRYEVDSVRISVKE